MGTRRKIMEACVRSRLTYGTQAMSPKEAELQRLETCWRQCLRSMVRNGWRRKPTPEDSDEKNYHLVYTNTQIEEIVQCMPIRDFIVMQHLKYIAHVCRQPNDAITKKLLFSSPSCAYSTVTRGLRYRTYLAYQSNKLNGRPNRERISLSCFIVNSGGRAQLYNVTLYKS